MKTFRLLLSFTLFLFPLFSQEKNLSADHSPAKSLVMNANTISTIVYNTAEISGPGVTSNVLDFVWKGLGYGYEFGFMVGAKVPTEHNPSDSVTIISEGIGASSHSTADGDFAPDGFTKWGFLPIAGYGNTASLEIANNQNPSTWDSTWPQWPGKFGSPIADLETFYAVDDFSNAEFDYFPLPADTTKRGLGIKVEARLYQFAHPNLEDVLFSFFEIQNMGPKPLTQMVAGIFGDPHIGGSSDYGDDSQDFDSTRKILYSWDVDHISGTSSITPGYFGTIMIETPLSKGLTSVSAMPFGGNNRPKNDQLMYDKLSEDEFDESFMYSNNPTSLGDFVLTFGTGFFGLGQNEKAEVGIAYEFADDLEGLIERTTTVIQEYKIRFGQQGSPVTISTPAQHEKYQSPSIQIQWIAASLDNDTTVDLYYSNTPNDEWKLIASHVPNSGSYSWDISSLSDGIFYNVHLINSKGGIISYGTLDHYFTIDHPVESPPEINLLSPKNIVLVTGILPVQWIAGDADGDSTSIQLMLSTDNGITYHTIHSVPNAGSYNIDTKEIENTPAARIKITAASNDTSVFAESKPFRIKNSYRALTDSVALGHVAGTASGRIFPGYVDSTALTGHTYRVTFDSVNNELRCTLKDISTNQIKLDNEPLTTITGSGTLTDGMRIWFKNDRLGMDPVRSMFAAPVENITAKVAGPSIGNIRYAPIDLKIEFGSLDTNAYGYYITPIDSVGSSSNPNIRTVKVPFKISMVGDTTHIQCIIKEGINSGKLNRWDLGEEIVVFTPPPYNITATNVHAGITFRKIEPLSNLTIPNGSIFYVRTTRPFTTDDVYEFTADAQYGQPTEVRPGENIPSHFALEQNFPNPFNPATTIRFSLARDGVTTLKIFDIMGREIKTIAAAYLQQGTHEYQWDGTNEYSQQAASGIYFYRLQSGSNVSVKKMLLMK